MPPIFSPENTGFTIGQIALNLALGFALAFFAATIYRRTHTGVAYSQGFFVSILVLPLIVAMIMMAIQGNIALSLGLVGSLSVIRFRTVIKDTRDMTYLFLAVGIGLCCGAGLYPVAILGTFVIFIVLIILHLAQIGSAAFDEYILICRHRTGIDPLESLPDRASVVKWFKLRSAVTLPDDDGVEYTYCLRLKDREQSGRLLGLLGEIDDVSRVSLISPDNDLAV